MLDRRCQKVLLLLFGLASVVKADGRVFVLELKNSSGLLGFRDAEQTCALQHARLASADELHHAVFECFFSTCTRGWLYGGTVGTTVCDIVGSTLIAVDVKTENVTEDIKNLVSFCIRDEGKPCGDPPSFPNVQLQGYTGFEMGDELLFTCMPGYMMLSGKRAFSLVCDSCGEWYGQVQLCVKDDTESHVDYEDGFTDSYKQDKGPEEAEGKIYEEAHDAVYTDGKGFQGHSEVILNAANKAEHQGQNVELHKPEELIDFNKKLDEAAVGEEQAEEGGIGIPSWDQEKTEVVRTEDAPATHSPVSLLSQKHLFWFPSEAFQEEHPVSTNSATQSTQRSSAAQSEESKEHDSKEGDHQHPLDFVDQETFYDKDEHHDSNSHNDSHRHNHNNEDSRQDDKDDRVIHFIPTRHNVGLSKQDRYDDDHDDHYDMGEHEDDRARYGSQEYDERGQTYDEHESNEDHEDLTDDHSVGNREHPDASREHLDHDNHDDVEEPYDPDDNDSYEDNSRQHVVFSVEDVHHNVTQKATEVKVTTDDTWLDGYPIVQKEKKGESTTEEIRPEQRDRGTSVQATKVPHERVPRPFPITRSPNKLISSTTEPGLKQKGAEEWPGLMPTAAAHPDPSDSHSYPDTFDYDTQQAAPTNSWPGDLTEHPYLDQGPAPPMDNMDVNDGTGAVEEHTIHYLPGEVGEREEVGGEKGEAVCTDENCPSRPPSSSRKGPTLAAIIIAVCVVAAAVIMGVWCYRRQLQKSSVYKMNGEGQNQNRQGQQIEMQQKV